MILVIDCLYKQSKISVSDDLMIYYTPLSCGSNAHKWILITLFVYKYAAGIIIIL